MYTYARNYKMRDELERHKDRKSCEISGTINLGGDPWPIYIDPNPENGYYDEENDKYISSGEKGVEVLLEPGDCMLYLGTQCEHWRDPLTDKSCSQVFLHYRETKDVTNDGWDKRLGPGMPVFTRRDK